jgi:tetratricopeptide (TPR) repeat protein
MIKSLLLLAALGLSAPAVGADLGQARALVDQKNYAAAIPVYDALLAQHPGQVDLLIEAGRVNAWADRHAEAVRLYRLAIDAAPPRRHDVLLALAWQLAWDGRQAAAIPLFAEVAQQVPSQRVEAQHGLAESLAATGRVHEALTVYRALAARPDDIKARHGEAQMLLWLDRDDAAAACYRAILQTHPADKEAQIGLARALN